ncbi:MAG: hypothetical protein R3C11_12650 [Planctomycetaceae bacterium]
MARRTNRTGHKKHSYFSITFWSLSLIAVTLYSGWRFGWIPLDNPHTRLTDYLPQKSSHIVAATDKGGPQPANLNVDTAEEESFNAREAESLSFNDQFEPEVTSAEIRESHLGHSPPQELNLAELNSQAAPIQRNENQPAYLSQGANQSGQSAIPGSRIRQISNEETVTSSPRNQVQVAAVPPENRERTLTQTNELPPPNLEEIDLLLQSNEYLKAHRLMSSLYWKHPGWRPYLQSRIDTTARSIYFAKQPHYLQPYVVQPGDQLRTIASRQCFVGIPGKPEPARSTKDARRPETQSAERTLFSHCRSFRFRTDRACVWVLCETVSGGHR